MTKESTQQAKDRLYPRSSDTMKFKLLVPEPEPWKIKAIAEYKVRMQRRAQILNSIAQKSAAQSSQIVDSSPRKKSTSSTNKKVEEQKLRTTAANNASTTQDPQRPDMGAVQKQAYLERTLIELEHWNARANAAKERIASLHAVKGSLLWLLKKASQHERGLINDFPPAPSSS